MAVIHGELVSRLQYDHGKTMHFPGNELPMAGQAIHGPGFKDEYLRSAGDPDSLFVLGARAGRELVGYTAADESFGDHVGTFVGWSGTEIDPADKPHLIDGIRQGVDEQLTEARIEGELA